MRLTDLADRLPVPDGVRRRLGRTVGGARPDGLPRELDGHRVLAHAVTAPASTGTGWVAGTVRGFHDSTGLSVPWELVQAADWDVDEETLTVSEIGEFARPRPEHVYELLDPQRLLMLVRERVTRTVVLQRWIGVGGRKRGFHVIARRGPDRGPGGESLRWYFEYARGTDPEAPDIVEARRIALAEARAELGGL